MKTNRLRYCVSEPNPLHKWWNSEPKYIDVLYAVTVDKDGNLIVSDLVVGDKEPDIADLVIEDIKKRKKQGKAKYGVPLRAFNGRDALQDLYEELVDAVQYLKQYKTERERTEEVSMDYKLGLAIADGVWDVFKKSKSKNYRAWLDRELGETKLQ